MKVRGTPDSAAGKAHRATVTVVLPECDQGPQKRQRSGGSRLNSHTQAFKSLSNARIQVTGFCGPLLPHW